MEAEWAVAADLEELLYAQRIGDNAQGVRIAGNVGFVFEDRPARVDRPRLGGRDTQTAIQ